MGPMILLGLLLWLPQAKPPKAQAKPAVVAQAPFRILVTKPLAGWTTTAEVPFTAEVEALNGAKAEQPLMLQSWINGEFAEQPVSAGAKHSFTIKPIGGENRVELRLAGMRVSTVRTFWGRSAQERLRIRLVQARSDGFWYASPYGWLEVVEPDGAALTSGTTKSGGHGSWDWFSHDQPPAGTWTLRWKYNMSESDPNTTQGDGFSGGGEGETQDTNMGKGVYRGRVYIEVVLDAGSDRERRWVFDRLFLPGRAQITLGSFDVEL